MSKKKGKVKTNVETRRSSLHLHPDSEVHQKDHKRSEDYRKIAESTSVVVEKGAGVRFPFTNRGMLCLMNGRALSVDEWEKYRSRERKKRNSYKYIRKVPRKNPEIVDHDAPIQAVAITHRPDHAGGVKMLEKEGISQKETIKAWGLKLAEEFQKKTGYESLAVAIHANENVLHYHVIYAVVSADNMLLHSHYGKKGNPRIKCMPHSAIGASRHLDCGLVPDERKEDAKWLKEVNKKRGFLPINFHLSRLLDSMADSHLRDPSRRLRLKTARKAWEDDVKKAYADSKAMLQHHLHKLIDENDGLRKKLSEANKSKTEIPESDFAGLATENMAAAKDIAQRLDLPDPSAAGVSSKRSNDEFLRQAKISMSLSTLRRYLDSREKVSKSDRVYDKTPRIVHEKREMEDMKHIWRSLSEGRTNAPEFRYLFEKGIEILTHSESWMQAHPSKRSSDSPPPDIGR